MHVARPFYPVLQAHDVTTLTQFVLTRKLPLIVAGDFNMTPWTDQLNDSRDVTGLGRYNTFHFTWPMRWREYPLMPVVAIDNVFASSDFAKIATIGGPRLGSDHRPIIADIALAPARRETVELPAAASARQCLAARRDPMLQRMLVVLLALLFATPALAATRRRDRSVEIRRPANAASIG